MPKQAFYEQNHAKLAADPPKYLGKIAKGTWRRIVPYLNSTDRVERIDTALVEQYCTEYEIYRKAYQDIDKNGIQSKLFKSVQNSAGKVIAKDFTGFRRNPAVSTLNDALKQLKSIGTQLGLSPKAPKQLMEIASNDSKGDTMSEMKKFFG